ncbi:hypothetical protein CALCODRAFT_380032 [Calocera cornea HHB12733]|uniref:Uncharacterized protein n=1 Tax=Calocera cornea HHB12733 TaxID=1353952 RepID=A0A165ECF3_9BASI|nr:hypothetical protein CALCODRAFT_380032 [Calocera cornea HHB12733]
MAPPLPPNAARVFFSSLSCAGRHAPWPTVRLSGRRPLPLLLSSQQLPLVRTAVLRTDDTRLCAAITHRYIRGPDRAPIPSHIIK